jgi:hypothetical protein
MLNMSDQTKRQDLRKILKNVKTGVPLESACWAADVDPEVFALWMKDDPRIRQAVMREYAVLERTLVKLVREGGRGMSAAKAALEVLERQFKTWARKTNVSLSTQINDVLEDLEKQFCVADGTRTFTGAQVYEIVLKAFAKHE